MAEEDVVQFKIVVSGDVAVGKTSVILRFCDDVFEDAGACTISGDFKEMFFEVEGEKIKLVIWDTAGQERYRVITSSYYRGAHGSIIVYDLNNRESLDTVTRWDSEVNRYLDNVEKIVIGNKSDLEKEVMEEEIEEVTENLAVDHFAVSAKTGENVKEAFTHLIKAMLRARAEEQAAMEKAAPVVIPDVNRGGSGCCGVQ